MERGGVQRAPETASEEEVPGKAPGTYRQLGHLGLEPGQHPSLDFEIY